jgi:hypothetical protein
MQYTKSEREPVEVSLRLQVPKSQADAILAQARETALTVKVVEMNTDGKQPLEEEEFWDAAFQHHLAEACSVLCSDALQRSGILERFEIELEDSSGEYSGVRYSLVQALEAEGHNETADALTEAYVTFDGQVMYINPLDKFFHEVQSSPYLPRIAKQLYGNNVTVQILKTPWLFEVRSASR